MNALMNAAGTLAVIFGAIVIFMNMTDAVYVDTVMQQISMRTNYLIGAVYIVGGLLMFGLGGIIAAIDNATAAKSAKPTQPKDNTEES